MKKIFGMVAIAVVAAVNVVASLNGNTTMSDLKLDNVEALGYTEIIYIPSLENGYRCLFHPDYGRCVYYKGPYSQCFEDGCQY